MSRSLSASSFITLPRLTAISTARLLKELLTAAANEKKVPASIEEDRAELSQALEALHVELTRRLAGEGAEPPRVRAADIDEDNAFGALSDWLSSFARLPDARHAEATEARAVLAAIFPSGLSFLAIRPRDEWQEAELRLQMIAKNGYDKAITALGGKPFLDELKAVHKVYGKALGITAKMEIGEPPSIREAKEAATDALRDYVLRVSAHVRKKDPESRALAERLLAPLMSWKDRPARGAETDGPPPVSVAPTGTAGAAPA